MARYANAVDALRHEAALIDQYGLDVLTNVLPGGSGAVKFSKTEDAAFVSEYAKLINRVRGERPGVVWVLGIVPVDLGPAFDRFDKHVKRIAKRRGPEWANRVAEKHNVQFV